MCIPSSLKRLQLFTYGEEPSFELLLSERAATTLESLQISIGMTGTITQVNIPSSFSIQLNISFQFLNRLVSSRFGALKELSLAGDRLPTSDYPLLAKLDNLRSLVLVASSIDDEGIEAIAERGMLEKLDLYACLLFTHSSLNCVIEKCEVR